VCSMSPDVLQHHEQGNGCSKSWTFAQWRILQTLKFRTIRTAAGVGPVPETVRRLGISALSEFWLDGPNIRLSLRYGASRAHGVGRSSNSFRVPTTREQSMGVPCSGSSSRCGDRRIQASVWVIHALR